MSTSKRLTPQNTFHSRRQRNESRARTPDLMPSNSRASFTPTYLLDSRNITSCSKQIFVDDDLGCDFATSDYLQALLKKEILEETYKKYEENITDQLTVQRDNLYKSQLALKDAKEELKNIDKYDILLEDLSLLASNCEEFNVLSTKGGLDQILTDLVKDLKSLCKVLPMKNPTTMSQERFDELHQTMKESLPVFKKVNAEERNVESVGSVAHQIEILKQHLTNLKQDQEFVSNEQKHLLFKLLKSLSDKYAEKESLKPKFSDFSSSCHYPVL